MATPTIQINNATGSDTAASGAGPTVALTGVGASTSANGLVVTLEGSPDLAGVAVDGSHALWVNTASGRQFAAIAAKDNTAKTVTTTTAYTANLAGQSWAIGGKRATIDNAGTRKLFSADYLSGWAADVQETGTSYTLASSLTFGVALAPFTLYSSSANRPAITTTTNGILLFAVGNTSGLTFRHLSLSHAATTRGVGIYPATQNCSFLLVSDCVLDGFSLAIDGTYTVGYAFPNLHLDACEIRNCTGSGVVTNNNNQATTATECFFHDNAGVVFNGMSDLTALDSVFARNSKAVVTQGGKAVFRRNVVQGHTATGSNAAVELVTNMTMVDLAGNIVRGNAGTGVSVTMSSVAANNLVNRSNAYGSNAAGNRSGFSAGVGDITLTADPFTNAASNDYTLNATAGGGALLRGVVNNVRAPGLVGTAHGDVGPFQHRSPGRAN